MTTSQHMYQLINQKTLVKWSNIFIGLNKSLLSHDHQASIILIGEFNLHLNQITSQLKGLGIISTENDRTPTQKGDNQTDQIFIKIKIITFYMH